jgi:peptidoglycan/LPS O-acetylase OafA/YrhL
VRERNQTVDALRAIAALSVCMFHFTAGAGVGAYGYLGVTIFFVISGFIVPDSMMRGGYTIAAWPSFMLKRLIRLEPPYLASIALTLVLHAWDMLHGRAPPWTAMQIAGHIGYANAFLGLPWLNAPYWSLAIEFQFYILMGLALPLLMLAGTPFGRLAGVALASCLPLLLPGHGNATILRFLPVFAAGTLCLLLAKEMIGPRSYWASLTVLAGIIFKTNDAPVAVAAIGTAVLLATVRMRRLRAIASLGAISYSLYLLHVPIGYRVIGTIRRLSDGELAPIVAIIGALVAAIAAAALLHRYVEQPSLRLAARIGYRAARIRRASNRATAAPSHAPGPFVGEEAARHAQPPSSAGGAPTGTLMLESPVPAASGAQSVSQQTPPVQRPLVHCTSKLHAAPGAAVFAGPHTPSSPATLSAARQRSLAAHVRSQQMPSSQCPLAHSAPREHEPVSEAAASTRPPSGPSTPPASLEPPSPLSTPSEKR